MITARRNNVSDSSSETSARGGIDVLERRSAFDVTETDKVSAPERRSEDEERDLRRKNLDRIMNYDRYAAIQAEERAAVKVEEPVTGFAPEKTATRVEEPKTAVAPEKATAKEDITPTSTTMQFGDGDTSKVYNDLERSKESQGYKLNAKGKLVLVLYSLVVAVILALIVINTGVLKSLDRDISALNVAYIESSVKVAAQASEIESISAESHIVEIVENEYGMIIR